MDTLNSSAENGKRTKKNASKMKKKRHDLEIQVKKYEL